MIPYVEDKGYFFDETWHQKDDIFNRIAKEYEKYGCKAEITDVCRFAYRQYHQRPILAEMLLMRRICFEQNQTLPYFVLGAYRYLLKKDAVEKPHSNS